MTLLYNDLNRYYLQQSPDLVSLDDVESVEMALDNILECPVRSFMFNRGFGAKLKSFLFEPINVMTSEAIKIYLIEATEAWEPRVTIDIRSTQVIPDVDGGISGMPGYYVRIVYVMRSTGQILQFIRALPTQTGT
jgi:phage baseplate assembly protein W